MPPVNTHYRRNFRSQLVANRRINSTSIIEQQKKKWSIVIQVIKVIAAILVPIMIGAFTIIQTLQELKIARMQRDANKEQQVHDSLRVIQSRIDTVYDTFIGDLSTIVLKPNNNLTESELMFARAKVLLILDLIDERRKWYLIKYLYDNQLFYAESYNKKFINLDGADLSNVKFGITNQTSQDERKINLTGIRLSNIYLRNSSFENVLLNNATFERSNLTGTKFLKTTIQGVNFNNATLEYSTFIGFQVQHSSFRSAQSAYSSWSSVNDFHGNDLSNSNWTGTIFCDVIDHLHTSLFLVDNSFIFTNRFENVTMKSVSFVRVRFYRAKIHGKSDLSDVLFEESLICRTLFEDVCLQRSRFVKIKLVRLQFIRVNLNGSNLDMEQINKHFIDHSYLPNGTFKSSIFGVNLIQNGAAEQDVRETK
ncbi:unnamed protein product [Rotaria sordida]|uniref:Pentapeptide repeat-containing protein n=1 Tax=Rotaria sordida TaxID=392033 RepID=A0A815YML3_9BILA|nr:unnamed protein product [Rotaria sordida]CAF1572566.1 unnamed protein product [Rotaria sordida]